MVRERRGGGARRTALNSSTAAPRAPTSCARSWCPRQIPAGPTQYPLRCRFMIGYTQKYLTAWSTCT
eukprot:4342686-Pyramimonas_sp.AAC.1